jgi:hypothetical protein
MLYRSISFKKSERNYFPGVKNSFSIGSDRCEKESADG